MKNRKKKEKGSYIDSGLRRRFGITFDIVKLGIFFCIIIAVAILITVSSFDVTMYCSRSTAMCEIKKTSILDPLPVELGKFSLAYIKEVNVTNRTVENGKSVYDIEIDRGPERGREFVDFAFNTIIKANTVKMKFLRFYEDLSKSEVVISKHCYFNDYFCF